MCLVEYYLRVCPHCSKKPRKGSPNKLCLNESEDNEILQTCENAAAGQSCNPLSEAGVIEEIWICKKEPTGEDARFIKNCKYHAAKDLLKNTWERDRELLEEMREKTPKHPKVVYREKGLTGPLVNEYNASYEILRALGIDGKAGLEYDDPKELEAAERIDDKYADWKERLAGWSPY